MKWLEKTWAELTASEMFALFRLRSEVFVVEQDCVYLDMDDKDAQSIHLGALDLNVPAGAAARAVVRLVPPGISYSEPSIGRVAISLQDRGTGLGQELMERSLRACQRIWPEMPIRISAQVYLLRFYESFGFISEGDPYEEDGLPHIQMYKPAVGWGSLRQQLEKSTETFTKRLVDLPDHALNGSTDSWGGYQVLQHLIWSEQNTLAYLAKKGQANPSDLPRADGETDERGWKLSKALMSDRKWKDPTGDRLTPSSDGFKERNEMEALLKSWAAEREMQWQSLSAIFENQLWWKVEVFNHPIAGRLTLLDALDFLSKHIDHHVHQLTRIQNALNSRGL